MAKKNQQENSYKDIKEKFSLQHKILMNLREYSVEAICWYWNLEDNTEEMPRKAEYIDEILDWLEDKGYIKYMSEREAKPEVRDPNDDNAEYIKVIKELNGLVLEDIIPQAKEFLFCYSCGTISEKLTIFKGKDTIYKTQDGRKYKLDKYTLPVGELEIKCSECGEEFALAPEQMERFGLL